MNQTVQPGPRSGQVRVPSSKSQLHRLLICAAASTEECFIRFDGLSNDIYATAQCLNALGAEICEAAEGVLRVKPIGDREGLCTLNCGESGSTLRFLLPLVGALGREAVFHREGRLPERPLSPLDEMLTAHGMTLRSEGADLYVSGRLHSGDYTLPGNISSQYISGLLMALPLCEGNSTLTVTGKRESEAYITMTEQVLTLSGITVEKDPDGSRYTIAGGQRGHVPPLLDAEGDWSGAAFFLCMGAMSPEGITVSGLNTDSVQGDRAAAEILRRFGAEVKEQGGSVAVRGGKLRGIVVDAAPIPDLIPVLSVVAAAAEGETRFIHAGRLRLKESDRLATTAGLLKALGADVIELPEELIVRGGKPLTGGTVSSCGDHRIAMSAAAAASLCRESVTITGSECTAKSYPAFWEHLEKLKL